MITGNPPFGKIFSKISLAFCFLAVMDGCASLSQKTSLPGIPSVDHRTVSVIDGCGFHSVAFSPNGRYIAAGGSPICVWDYQTGALVHRFSAPVGGVSQKAPRILHGQVMVIAFSPDSQWIAGGHFDGTVRLWSISSGKEEGVLIGHENVVRDLVFSPDGKLIASASLDTTIRIWDAGTGKEVHLLGGYEGYMETVGFSPDGRILVGGGNDHIRAWSVQSGEEIAETDLLKNMIRYAEFGPDGKKVYIVGFSGFLGFWEIQSGHEVHLVSENPDYRGFPADLSPNGKYLLLASESNRDREGKIFLYDASSGTIVRVFEDGIGVVRGLAFSPDGKFFATVGDDRLRLWSIEEDKPVRRFD